MDGTDETNKVDFNTPQEVALNNLAKWFAEDAIRVSKYDKESPKKEDKFWRNNFAMTVLETILEKEGTHSRETNIREQITRAYRYADIMLEIGNGKAI